MRIIPTAEFPLGQLPPEDWMTDPATKAVIKALESDGQAMRFVGGCVRDALAHRPVKDIDMATPERPEKVIELLESANIKAIPTGIEHGTITAEIDGQRFEITTLRRDVKTDGRHAEVVFDSSWQADALRRDFTINAFSATKDGAVYDPFNGLDDLSHGRVRFIGPPDQRIQEDALRILRFFRFYALFGRPPANASAMAGCRRFAGNLKNLSADRIWGEFRQILLHDNVANIIVLMSGARVMDEMIPHLADVGVLRALSWLESRALNIGGLIPDPLRRLAALVDASKTSLNSLSKQFNLTNDDRDYIAALLAVDDSDFLRMNDADYQRLIRRDGRQVFLGHVLLSWAGKLVVMPKLPTGENKKWASIVELALTWVLPVFPLTGNDVMALGVDQGPDIGNLLRRVETWWEIKNYKPQKQACLTELKKQKQEMLR